MKNDFLSRITLERDYKISLLHEELDSGHLEKESLFQRLKEITTVQYRIFGHYDLIHLTAKSTVEAKLKSAMKSFVVLEKSISFIDGIVAALSASSMNRYLLNSYHGKNNELSIRDEIIAYGQNEILESHGLQSMILSKMNPKQNEF